MDIQHLQTRFEECELPVSFVDRDPRVRPRWLPPSVPSLDDFLYVDVQARRTRREHFRVFADPRAELAVIDHDADQRRLLLYLRCFPTSPHQPEKRTLLFGHDERQLFVVPARSTLRQTLDSLKPPEAAWAEMQGTKVKRQGDWFFIPVSAPTAQDPLVRYSKIALGGHNPRRLGVMVGHPHIADEQLISYGRPIEVDRHRRVVGVRIYVRGAVRHAEHSTLTLRGWHRAVQSRTRGGTDAALAGSVWGMIGYRD